MSFCGRLTRNTILHVDIIDLQSRYYNCRHYHTVTLLYVTNRLTPRDVRHRTVRRYSIRPLTTVRRVLVQCCPLLVSTSSIYRRCRKPFPSGRTHKRHVVFWASKFHKLSEPKGREWRQLSDKMHVMSLYNNRWDKCCQGWVDNGTKRNGRIR